MLEKDVGGCTHREIMGIVGAPKTTMLVLAGIMVGKEIDGAALPRQGLEEQGGLTNGVVIGIDTVDQGYADEEIGAFLGKEDDVPEDQLVGHAGIEAVLAGVDMLEVDEHELALVGNLGDDFLRGIERGVDGAVETTTPQLAKQLERDVRMHEGLAATKGHPSPTIFHDVALLLNLGHQSIHGPQAATHLQSGGGAFVDATTRSYPFPTGSGTMTLQTLSKLYAIGG